MKVAYLVLVPFRTSHMEHLNASALFLKVQMGQSQAPSASGEWGPPAEAGGTEEPAPDPEAAPLPPFALLLRLDNGFWKINLGFI